MTLGSIALGLTLVALVRAAQQEPPLYTFSVALAIAPPDPAEAPYPRVVHSHSPTFTPPDPLPEPPPKAEVGFFALVGMQGNLAVKVTGTFPIQGVRVTARVSREVSFSGAPGDRERIAFTDAGGIAAFPPFVFVAASAAPKAASIAVSVDRGVVVDPAESPLVGTVVGAGAQPPELVVLEGLRSPLVNHVIQLTAVSEPPGYQRYLGFRYQRIDQLRGDTAFDLTVGGVRDGMTRVAFTKPSSTTAKYLLQAAATIVDMGGATRFEDVYLSFRVVDREGRGFDGHPGQDASGVSLASLRFGLNTEGPPDRTTADAFAIDAVRGEPGTPEENFPIGVRVVFLPREGELKVKPETTVLRVEARDEAGNHLDDGNRTLDFELP